MIDLKPKFNLYANVISKKITDVITGKIICIIDPVFLWEVVFSRSTPGHFDLLYPRWLDSPVYMVQFQKPIRGVTFKIFKELMENYGYTDEKIIQREYNLKQLGTEFYLPEEDLSIFDIEDKTN